MGRKDVLLLCYHYMKDQNQRNALSGAIGSLDRDLVRPDRIVRSIARGTYSQPDLRTYIKRALPPSFCNRAYTMIPTSGSPMQYAPTAHKVQQGV